METSQIEEQVRAVMERTDSSDEDIDRITEYVYFRYVIGLYGRLPLMIGLTLSGLLTCGVSIFLMSDETQSGLPVKLFFSFMLFLAFIHTMVSILISGYKKHAIEMANDLSQYKCVQIFNKERERLRK